MFKANYLIPTWNSGTTLDITLSSIENHGNPSQMIIVDRCSQDEILEIAQRHGCKIIDFNGSLGAARLLGARTAQTDFIGFVDFDVELTEDRRNILFYALNKEYEEAGVYGAYYQGLSEIGREELQFRSTENVLLSGYVSQDELVGHYPKAKVFCQLSYCESIGSSPAEAMACGCMPAVTERGNA